MAPTAKTQAYLDANRETVERVLYADDEQHAEAIDGVHGRTAPSAADERMIAQGWNVE